MIDFSKIPFVRLLIPYLTGILLCKIFHINFNVLIVLNCVFAALVVMFFYNRKSATLIKSSVYVFLSDLFLFLSAVYSCYYINPKNYSDFYGHFLTKENCTWVAEVTDLPVEKENFYKIALDVKSIQNGADFRNVQGKVLAYFKKPFDKKQLSPGDFVEIYSEFLPVQKPLNPNEFNYKNFLSEKGIYFQTFIESGSHKLIRNYENLSLKVEGLKVKAAILDLFNSPLLNKSAAQLCAALLTGYDDEISKETINAFAHSGTLHVLSVSGLHTGIIYGVVVFLLGVVDKNKRFKIVHPLILLSVLFVLVLITGFSPPVLRAVIMLGFLAIGKYYYNYLENASVNIMAVSAFMILLFNPLLICDVGFLLSYTAILGILLFGPQINSLFRPGNKVINKVWQLSAISIAAQVSTLPVTLYYFHQFPVWFVFTNLIVIPICTLIMFCGFLFLMKLSFVSVFINKMSSLIFGILQITDMPGLGYIDKIDFDIKDLYFMISVIMMIIFFVKFKTYFLLKAALIVVLCWQIFSLINVYSKKASSFVGIYQVNKFFVVDCKNAEKLMCSSNVDSSSYNYHVKTHQITYNYPILFNHTFSYIKSENISFLQVKSEEEFALIDFLKPHVILFSCNPEIDNYFTISYKPKKIIADGSNSYLFVKKLKKVSEMLGIPFSSTKESGFIKLNL